MRQLLLVWFGPNSGNGWQRRPTDLPVKVLTESYPPLDLGQSVMDAAIGLLATSVVGGCDAIERASEDHVPSFGKLHRKVLASCGTAGPTQEPVGNLYKSFGIFRGLVRESGAGARSHMEMHPDGAGCRPPRSPGLRFGCWLLALFFFSR